MISTADFRNGMVVLLDGNLVEIVEFQHVKPGKGGAFVRTRFKNVMTGRVIDTTRVLRLSIHLYLPLVTREH